MKLYSNIPQLFSVQFKIGLYNTDMSGKERIKEKKMLNNFEDINLILDQMVDEGTIEPIDDPSVEVNFWDWADIVGAIDDFVPEEYDHA